MQSGIAPLQEPRNRHPRVRDTARSGTQRSKSILIIGASFKTSPIEFRERLAAALRGRVVLKHPLRGVEESVILQTCNRIELYLVTGDAGGSEADFFSRLPARLGTQRDCFYVLGNMEAVTHLFELASGLDSMVVGEDQILSQIVDASTNARLDGSSRAVLSRLFDVATRVGKHVRSSGAIPSEGQVGQLLRAEVRAPEASRKAEESAPDRHGKGDETRCPGARGL